MVRPRTDWDQKERLDNGVAYARCTNANASNDHTYLQVLGFGNGITDRHLPIDAAEVYELDLRAANAIGRGPLHLPVLPSIAHYALALSESMSRLDLRPEQTIVGGISFGGIVAMGYLSTTDTAHPAAVLLNTCLPQPPWAAASFLKPEYLRYLLHESERAALANEVFGGVDSDEARAAVEAAGEFFDNSLCNISQSLAVRACYWLEGVIGRITTPTALIVGQEDKLVPLEQSRTLAEKLPAATLTIIEGAGHIGTITHPNEYAAAVNAASRSAHLSVSAQVA